MLPLRLPTTHRSTWLIGMLAVAVGVVANLGGDYHPPIPFENTDRISFGWPWVYADWEHVTGQRNLSIWWRLDQINVWYPFSLVGNGCVLLLLAAAIAAAWEWRRRKVTYLCQFTLADIFLGSLLLTAFYGVERWVCRDTFAEREFRLSLSKPWYFDRSEALGIADGCFNDRKDIPADWFWELFAIPPTHRPYRRLKLNLQFYDDPEVKLTPRGLELLSRCRGMRDFTCSGRPLADLGSLQTWRELRNLTLNADLTDNSLRSLPSFPQLQSLKIFGGKFTDNGVSELGRLPRLQALDLIDCDQVHGCTFASLSAVEKLWLLYTPLTNKGVVALGKMPQLRELHVAITAGSPQQGTLNWQPLAKSQSLTEFGISGNGSRFDFREMTDEGLAAVAKIPNLRSIFVGSSEITDEGVQNLIAVKKLEELTLVSDNGGLSDATIDFFAERKWPAELFLYIDNASQAAMDRLRKAHPTATVQNVGR